MNELPIRHLTPEQQAEIDRAVEAINETTPSYKDSVRPLQAWRLQYRRFATYLMERGKTLEEINEILGQGNNTPPTNP